MLRGYIAPIGVASVKTVVVFVDNYKRGYPSEFATINLMEARTGVLRAVDV